MSFMMIKKNIIGEYLLLALELQLKVDFGNKIHLRNNNCYVSLSMCAPNIVVESRVLF